VGYFCLFLNICHAPRCQPSCKRFDGELHREETILTFWKAGRSGTVIPESSCSNDAHYVVLRLCW
jgi:hypothetical protein